MSEVGNQHIIKFHRFVVCVLFGYYLVVSFSFFFFSLDVVIFCFLGCPQFCFSFGFSLFLEKELEVRWVGRGEDLERHGEGKNTIKIYLNLKIVLNNENTKIKMQNN